MATSPDEADCRARAFFRYVCDPAQATKESTFDRTALQYIDFDSVKAERPGHTYCEIVAVHAVCNGMGSLHGGCIGTWPASVLIILSIAVNQVLSEAMDAILA